MSGISSYFRHLRTQYNTVQNVFPSLDRIFEGSVKPDWLSELIPKGQGSSVTLPGQRLLEIIQCLRPEDMLEQIVQLIILVTQVLPKGLVTFVLYQPILKRCG